MEVPGNTIVSMTELLVGSGTSDDGQSSIWPCTMHPQARFNLTVSFVLAIGRIVTSSSSRPHVARIPTAEGLPLLALNWMFRLSSCALMHRISGRDPITGLTPFPAPPSSLIRARFNI